MKTEQISTRITQEQRKQLDLIVRRTGIGDLSDHVRKAIDEYVARHGASNDAQPSETN